MARYATQCSPCLSILLLISCTRVIRQTRHCRCAALLPRAIPGVWGLIHLRKTEPSLRGCFRIPLGRGGVIIVAAFPMLILIVVIAISFRDEEYGIPGVIGAAVAVALGPVVYRMAQCVQINRQ